MKGYFTLKKEKFTGVFKVKILFRKDYIILEGNCIVGSDIGFKERVKYKNTLNPPDIMFEDFKEKLKTAFK